MACPLLWEVAASAAHQHTHSRAVLPTSWALPSPLPLIPVSPGGLWSRAEAKNTFLFSDFIFRCTPEGATSELLVFA